MRSSSLWVSISYGLGLWEWQTSHSKHWEGRGTTKMRIVEHDNRTGAMLAVLPWETKLKIAKPEGKCPELLCSGGGDWRVLQLAGQSGYLNQWAKAQWETFSLQIRWGMIEKSIPGWPLTSTHTCAYVHPKKSQTMKLLPLRMACCCPLSPDRDYLHGTTTKLGY